MKEKIKAALRTKYANVGLSDKVLDGVASVIEKTITKEDEIEAMVGGELVDGLIKSIQGDTDRLRTSNASLQKELDELKKPKQETQKDEPKQDSDIAKLTQMVSDLTKRIDDRESSEKRSRVIESVRGIMKAQGSSSDAILNLVLKDAVQAEGETPEAMAGRLKSEYDSTYKEFYGNGPTPPAGGGGGGGKEENFSDFAESLRAKGKLPPKKDS